MFRFFGFTLLLAAALLAHAGTAAAQVWAIGPSLEKVAEEYRVQLGDGAMDLEPQLKAVPRVDKAEATIIGTVVFVDDTDFLPDGTPLRIVVVRSRKPITQDVVVVCPGSALVASCGRLGIGRRASFTSDILVIPEGESAGLALLMVKRLQT